MSSQNSLNTSFANLPRDMLSLIMSKVAQRSREDIQTAILSCPELADAVNDFQVFRTMNLNDIVIAPLLAVTTYPQLIAKCLAHSNPSAQYIAGVLHFFHQNNTEQGMLHLRGAADADAPVHEAVYLYGIIKMCTGEYEVGKQYLARLGSSADDLKCKKCWKNIKRSLHGIGNVDRTEYLPALLEMLPPAECNLNDMTNSCTKCYHYKKMFRFIFTI